MKSTKNVLNIRNNSEVYNEIQKTLKKIDEYVIFNEYRYSNEVKIDGSELSALQNASLKKKKVLRKLMYKINVKTTLQTLNKFFHFLFKRILKSDSRVKVLKSEKEQQIMLKRENYNKALLALRKAKQEYLVEKGDFYKQRILKNQSI